MIDLSLAIIVKNEEENLANCLDSAAKYVGEIVVVDTGSTDKTVEVAKSHGARVHYYTPETDPAGFFVDDEATCSTFGAPGPYSGKVMLGDFGAARRRSFDLTTKAYTLWLDADDILEGGKHLSRIVEEMKTRRLDMAFMSYDYARDDQGRTFYRQWRERIVRRGITSWINPVHEVMMPAHQVNTAKFNGVNVVHRRKADRPGPAHRNYKILLRHHVQELAAGKTPDPRTLFYLGQEARWTQPLRAAEFYEAYLETSGWPEERAAAHKALAEMSEMGMLGLPPGPAFQRANREFAVSAVEIEENPDGLFGLARVAYMRQRWADCVRYTERGLKIGNTDSMLGANPLERTYRPHVYYNHALSNLGRLEEAVVSCKAALAVCPDDPGVPGGAPGMLKHNLMIYEAELARRAAPQKEEGKPMVQFDKNEDVDAPAAPGIPQDALVIWAMQLWKRVRGDEARERALLAALPVLVASDPVVGRMRSSTDARHPREQSHIPKMLDAAMTPMADQLASVRETLQQPRKFEGKKSVVFWIGPAVEPWDPTTPDTKGIGGSETACVEMARELAALGHDVKVYGELPNQHYDKFNGVHYIPWQQARTPLVCDVFISSRVAAVMERPKDVQAAVKLLWVHDVNVGPDGPDMQRWLMRFDRILCLSNWHKDHFVGTYPGLDPARVLVTRNGIRPERFATEQEKRNRLIFSSSPNRGLDTLLHNFPFIKSRVPDAELHVYYGFDCWETFAKMRNDVGELAEIQRYKDLIARAPAGVHSHGRVNQRELAEAFMRSKVWAYPTNFPETSCCHPDTLISVPGDHRGGVPRVRITDLVGKSGFPVYAYDAEQHRFRMATALRVWETKIADEMVAIEMDDGNALRLTPDHLVMTLDGEWVCAGDLQPGQRLMALHHRYNVMIKDANGSWTNEHRLVGEWKMGRELLQTEHVDHSDALRLDNSPDMLQVLTAQEHFRKTHTGRVQSKIREQVRISKWQEWAAAHPEELRARLGRNGKKLWDWVRSLPLEAQVAWKAERAQKKVATEKARRAADPAYAAAYNARARSNGKKGADARWNHMVVAVRKIPGGPVYDMEVEGLHNFVADGVVVHNCITAMEAQAAGCVPVCTALAALPETVKCGILIKPSSTYGQEFVDACVDLLTSEHHRGSLAADGRLHALENLSWRALAGAWSKMFDDVGAAVATDPLPGWVEVSK